MLEFITELERLFHDNWKNILIKAKNLQLSPMQLLDIQYNFLKHCCNKLEDKEHIIISLADYTIDHIINSLHDLEITLEDFTASESALEKSAL